MNVLNADYPFDSFTYADWQSLLGKKGRDIIEELTADIGDLHLHPFYNYESASDFRDSVHRLLVQARMHERAWQRSITVSVNDINLQRITADMVQSESVDRLLIDDPDQVSEAAMSEVLKFIEKLTLPVDLTLYPGGSHAPLNQFDTLYLQPFASQRFSHQAAIEPEAMPDMLRDYPLLSIAVDASHYPDFGLSPDLTLAFIMAEAIETIQSLCRTEDDLNALLDRFRFRFSSTSHFLTDVAMLRATRYLWHQILRRYQIDPKPIRIDVEPARWTQIPLDVETNVLRQTTAVMSAVMGGADRISTRAYSAGNQSDPMWTAMQIQNLLMHESQLHQVIDPLNGAYAVEHLTDQLIHNTWKHLRHIEGTGGFRLMLADGRFDRALTSAAADLQQSVSSGQRKLIGLNFQPNPKDHPNHLKTPPGRAIHYWQSAANAILHLRARVAEYEFPAIIRIETGAPGVRTERSNFIRNLLQVGGIESSAMNASTSEELNAQIPHGSILFVCGDDAGITEFFTQLSGMITTVYVIGPVSAKVQGTLIEGGAAGVIEPDINVHAFLDEFVEQYGVSL